MGMITVLLLRNDHLGEIQDNAQEFIDNAQQAVQMHGMGHAQPVRAGNAANAADVVSVAHASHDHFVRVHGNTAHTVGWNNATQEDLDAMAAFLKAKGYGIRAPRAKTTAP
jgi:ABC-type transporter Mla subunit MlaD